MGTIQILDTALNVLEIVSCITGFILFKKLRGSYWRWFPYYLAFIVVAEFTGKYFLEHKMLAACEKFCNLFEVPVEFLFFFWLFYRNFRESKYRKIPLMCIAAYLLCWLTDNLFLSKMNFWFYSFSYTCGNLLLLVLILTYFIGLVTTDAILKYKQDMLFWVSTGLLLFYLGTFPYYGLRNTLVYNYKQLYITYSYIMYILNCLMYLMFTFSFIWGKPNSRSL